MPNHPKKDWTGPAKPSFMHASTSCALPRFQSRPQVRRDAGYGVQSKHPNMDGAKGVKVCTHYPLSGNFAGRWNKAPSTSTNAVVGAAGCETLTGGKAARPSQVVFGSRACMSPIICLPEPVAGCDAARLVWLSSPDTVTLGARDAGASMWRSREFGKFRRPGHWPLACVE